MTSEVIKLEENLKIVVYYNIIQESEYDMPGLHKPKSVDEIIIGQIWQGTCDHLCQFIDSHQGNFYDYLEVKILEMED